MDLFDFENDFTEEEEAVFSPKATATATTVPTVVSTVYPAFSKLVKQYKEGVPVRQLLKTYGISSNKLYKILEHYNVKLRGGLNINSNNTKDKHVFISEVAERFNLTAANIRGYCQILERKGYSFSRISRQNGGKNARIFTEEDIKVVGKMIDAMQQGFSMEESALIAIGVNAISHPSAELTLEGETLYINVTKHVKQPINNINISFSLKGDK